MNQNLEARIKYVIARLAGHPDDYLDEDVIQAKSEEASILNNSGYEDQVRYLVSRWGIDNVEKLLEK